MAPLTVTRLLLLSVAGMLCEGFDLQAAGVAAAGIVQEVKPDRRLLEWFFSASTVGLLIGAPIGGWLGDRRGRAGVVQGAMLLFALSSIATGMSSTVTELIVARLATGLELGGAIPNLIALAAESDGAARAADVLSIDARYIIETADGVRLSVTNRGLRAGPRAVMERLTEGEPVSPFEYYFRTAAQFDAPRGATPASQKPVRSHPPRRRQRDSNSSPTT